MIRVAILVLLCCVAPGALAADDFRYRAPGAFAPNQQGQPRANDRRVYAPDIAFPIRFDPASGESVVLNSQVYGKSPQCAAANYAMPWSDTFCEARGWPMGMCPNGKGHQGVDIRPVRCRNNDSEVVAVEDGTIDRVTAHTTIGLVGGQGRHWRYMHVGPATVLVRPGQKVRKGQVLARVSNILSGIPNTTYHLHLDLSGNIAGPGSRNVYLPPYSSLVDAYRRSVGLPSTVVNGDLVRDPGHEL